MFTVINTNGYKINQLADLLPYIDSISLSRHHYSDMKNQTIFKLDKVPLEEEIANFPDKSKLHISCNLMKDYIGTMEEVINFLEWASSINCKDIGFVSLMPTNEYCKEQFVDFNDLNFENMQDIFITKNWNYENLCKCRNYIYITKKR